jgi:hypothetical protein
MISVKRAERFLEKDGLFWDGKRRKLNSVKKLSDEIILGYFEENVVCNLEIVKFEIDGKWKSIS